MVNFVWSWLNEKKKRIPHQILHCIFSNFKFPNWTFPVSPRFRALERNAYNHITATYYLLAESRLRKQREKHSIGKTQGKTPGKSALKPRLAAGQQGNLRQVPKSKLAPLALSPRYGNGVMHLNFWWFFSPDSLMVVCTHVCVVLHE